jgi:hypothetical protein
VCEYNLSMELDNRFLGVELRMKEDSTILGLDRSIRNRRTSVTPTHDGTVPYLRTLISLE